jgi:hypothetical protein
MSFMGGFLLAGSAPAYYIGAQKTQDFVTLQAAPSAFVPDASGHYVTRPGAEGVVQIGNQAANSVAPYTPDGTLGTPLNSGFGLSGLLRAMYGGSNFSLAVYGTGITKSIAIQVGDLTSGWTASAITGAVSANNLVTIGSTHDGALLLLQQNASAGVNDAAAWAIRKTGEVNFSSIAVEVGTNGGRVACSASRTVIFSSSAIKVCNTSPNIVGSTTSWFDAITAHPGAGACSALAFIPRLNLFVCLYTLAASIHAGKSVGLYTSPGNDGANWTLRMLEPVPGPRTAATAKPARIADGALGVVVTYEGVVFGTETSTGGTVQNRLMHSLNGTSWTVSALSLPLNDLPICYA